MSRGSIGGVTVGNNWVRNNPDLAYPDHLTPEVMQGMSNEEILRDLNEFNKDLRDGQIIHHVDEA